MVVVSVRFDGSVGDRSLVVVSVEFDGSVGDEKVVVSKRPLGGESLVVEISAGSVRVETSVDSEVSVRVDGLVEVGGSSVRGVVDGSVVCED